MIKDGYYWRFDGNKTPVDIEIVCVEDGEVWVIGFELSLSIDYLTDNGITIVQVDPPGFGSA
jgi:hypothetical protein